MNEQWVQVPVKVLERWANESDQLRDEIRAWADDLGEWTAKYWRYGLQSERTFPSLDLARAWLQMEENEGTLSPVSVVGPDGIEREVG